MHLPPPCKPMRHFFPCCSLLHVFALPVSLLLLLTIPSTLAQRYVCHLPVHAYDPNYPPPPIPDCQYLLSHLPRVSLDHFPPLAEGRPLSRNHPFQPQGHLTHGKCRLTITLLAAPSPPYLSGNEPEPDEGASQAIWNFLGRSDLNIFLNSLPEFTVMHIWRGVRNLGNELLAACVEDQQRAGVVVGRLGDLIPGAWYYIGVGTLGDVTSMLDNRVTARVRAGLHDLLLPEFHGQPMYLYEMPSYQV